MVSLHERYWRWDWGLGCCTGMAALWGGETMGGCDMSIERQRYGNGKKCCGR